MQAYNIDTVLFQTLFTEQYESFIEGLCAYFLKHDIYDYTIWNVTGNICEASPYSTKQIKGAFDLYELGYNSAPVSAAPKNVQYFEQTFFIQSAFFFQYKDYVTAVVTFHNDIPRHVAHELEEMAPYIAKRFHEIGAKNRQMDLYVDYQKKVDFVKRASVIFKALEVDDVISVSLSFFMEVFSADAVFAIKGNTFSGIGIEEEDLETSITMHGRPLDEFIARQNDTEFFDEGVTSSKFNIRNMFVVVDNTVGIKFALFNIIVDIVPDKDFSSLVSGIVSIAVENAMNHESMTKFKLEEMEIAKTVDILKCFVKEQISIQKGYDIYAVNYPARNAGGDFMDVRVIGDDILFCIADVCGKGYSAAVFTVVLSFLASLLKADDIEHSIENLNNFLLDKNFDSRFITAFFGIVHTKDRTLEYISCGHDPIAVLYSGGTMMLTSEYMPLGLVKEHYSFKSVVLPEHSMVLSYTDGLTEYASLEDILCYVNIKSSANAKEIAQSLYSTLVQDHSLQRDDFTCIIMKL